MISSSGISTMTQLPGPTQGLTAFTFDYNAVRVVVLNNEPWFLAADVCTVLDLGNPSQALTRLDEEEKSTLISNDGGPGRNIISESGLFSLILGSRKPSARVFKKWVTTEVLPTIRKTGSYRAQSKPLTTSDLYLAQAQFNVEREARIETLINQQESMSAKLDEIDRMLQRSKYSTRDMQYGMGNLPLVHTAVLLGTGTTRMFQFLRAQHILSSAMATWNQPLDAYVSAGLIENVPRGLKRDGSPTSLEVMFTPKGRRWMFENACRGWLDKILNHDALEARVTTALDLPLPLDFEPKPR
jgi:prophage antirepressor-like protein